MNLFESGTVKNTSSRPVKVKVRFLGTSPSLAGSMFLEITSGSFQLTLWSAEDMFYILRFSIFMLLLHDFDILP